MREPAHAPGKVSSPCSVTEELSGLRKGQKCSESHAFSAPEMSLFSCEKNQTYNEAGSTVHILSTLYRLSLVTMHPFLFGAIFNVVNIGQPFKTDEGGIFVNF